MIIEARQSSTERYRLGEGVVWDDRGERLLWVDIDGGALYDAPLPDGDNPLRPRRLYSSDETVGCVVLGESGELLLAEGDHLVLLDGSGKVHRSGRIIPGDRPRRLNDGACDPQGRLLVGTLSTTAPRCGEQLLRVEADGSVATVLDGLTLANGIAFSPDGSTMFIADTLRSTIWVSDQTTLGWKPAFTVDGLPDGMTTDSQGRLWIAMWGAGEVRCIEPDGFVHAIVHVPAPHVTSVAFAGTNLDRLIITTATKDLDTRQLAEFPASGALFVADVDAVGLPTHRWSQALAFPLIHS